MMTEDPYTLHRFVDAQHAVFDRVRAELRTGRKQSHWMWFVFPQIAGLGHSPTAVRYAISSLDEARAYLAHSILGQRIRECTQLVLDTNGRTIEQIFGHPDDLKFHSSMTLFVHAMPDNGAFLDALGKYFGGRQDAVTLAKIA